MYKTCRALLSVTWLFGAGVATAIHADDATLVCRETPSAIQVALASDGQTDDSRILLQYNKAHVVPAFPIAAHYGRSAHLHPVRTRSGRLVTDEFPPDHAHQSGIFLGYPKTIFADKPLDFWNLAGQQGHVRYQQTLDLHRSATQVRFSVRQAHVDLRDAEDKIHGGQVVAQEDWTVTITLPDDNATAWTLDIESELQCVTDQPLLLPEYHYGGMAIRGARTWLPEVMRITTPHGTDRQQANHARAPWCDMFGAVDGQVTGAVMMTHPKNFRFPEPLRIHPTMPYMVYTPSQLGAWELRPDEVHRSRYRFLIHDGELTSDDCARAWQAYANATQ